MKVVCESYDCYDMITNRHVVASVSPGMVACPLLLGTISSFLLHTQIHSGILQLHTWGKNQCSLEAELQVQKKLLFLRVPGLH